MNEIIPGDIWEHSTTGNKFKVICVSQEDWKARDRIVVMQAIDGEDEWKDKFWHKPLYHFRERFIFVRVGE